VGGAQKRRLHRTVWRGSSRAASQSVPCSRRRCAAARPVAGGLGRRRRPADRPIIGQRARNGGRWWRDLALAPAGSCRQADCSGEQGMRGTRSSGCCGGAVGSPARWSATPAVSQADQGRQRAASHPAPTVTAGVARATHLWCRAREATWPPVAAGRVRGAEQRRRGARRSSALRRSATARAAKRWQLQHELAIVVGPEMVATASRAPELNGGSGRSRLHGRRDTARAFRAAGQKRTRQVVKRRGSSS
jgi:hypothetical protein